jgi:hypothetical protein
MANALYLYSILPLGELERLMKNHQEDFDELIGDQFSESELVQFEKMLDSIAAIYVQPIISELQFDDFFAPPELAERQRFFFESCKSSLCIENIPDFHTNPFQVTYLIELLRNFDEVLIDRGGVQELCFKNGYCDELKRFKNIFSLVPSEPTVAIVTPKNHLVDPIDLLLSDIYLDIQRLKNEDKMTLFLDHLGSASEKVQKVYKALEHGPADSIEILRKSGLNTKDFDDNLEKLKFLLRRIQ